jgi:hypothetical protein
MNRKIVTVVCLLAILVVVLAYVILSSPPSTLLFVEPQTLQGTTGQNFTINITISHVSRLYGWEVKIGWNASVLDLVDVVEGSFLKNAGLTFFTHVTNVTSGYSLIDCTLTGIAAGVD